MATYQTDAIVNKQPARLVKVGLTPKYEEIDPTTLATGDVYEVFVVPGGVRLIRAFIVAVGGTGLDTNGTPTLTLKLELTDGNGTRTLINTTSAVRATDTSAEMSNNRGYLVNSVRNKALVTLTVVAGAATLGTSNIGVYLEWSGYTDD